MAKQSSNRSRAVPLATLQPRSRRETLFLIGALIIAAFFIIRICQFRALTPRGSTITAVLSTTQVLRSKHGANGEDEPAAVFTEVFIDSGSGEGFRRPRKQSDILVKPDKPKQAALPQPVVNSSKANLKSATALLESNQHVNGSTLERPHHGPELPVKSPKQQASRDKLLPGQRAGQKAATASGLIQAATVSSDRALTLEVPKPKTVELPKPKLATEAIQSPLPVAQDSSPAPQTSTRITSVPADFDWQTYLLYNPELRDAGISSQQQAEAHYIQTGYYQGLMYKRLRVLLRYTACTGLINQHYSHIAAFSLSAVLGAELVLPPAVKRDSFAHYFSVFKEHNEVKWTPAPLESLLNVDKIVDFWQGRGLTVHRTPALLPFPDLTQPELAYPMYPQPEIDPELVARIEDVYLRNLDMPELIEKARVAVITHAGKLLRANPARRLEYVVLDLPCTFFMLRSLSNLRVVTEVARSLEFAPKIAALADRVIHGMTMAGKYEYNAVHLRIEKDARDWSQIMGGEEVVWRGYVQSMLQAGFTSDLVLYAASGLLTYGANDEMDTLIGTLKDAGLCKDVHYKELYIPQAELEELNSEQKALLDFMVLSRGRGFVGFGSSTFSFYLREYRVLSGVPRSSSVLVDASVIGTDPLFNSAGTVI